MEIDKKNPRPKRGILIKLGIVVIIIAAIAIALVFLLKGKETTSGSYPNNIKTQSLICKSSTYKYPKIETEELYKAKKYNAEVIMMFNQQGAMESISFEYQTSYDTPEEAEEASSRIHYSFSNELEERGFKFTDLGNKFSHYDNTAAISLYAKGNEFSTSNASYFAIDTTKPFPSKLTDYKTHYERQGFACNTKS